jgi:hypothetical protein
MLLTSITAPCTRPAAYRGCSPTCKSSCSTSTINNDLRTPPRKSSYGPVIAVNDDLGSLCSFSQRVTISGVIGSSFSLVVETLGFTRFCDLLYICLSLGVNCCGVEDTGRCICCGSKVGVLQKKKLPQKPRRFIEKSGIEILSFDFKISSYWCCIMISCCHRPKFAAHNQVSSE